MLIRRSSPLWAFILALILTVTAACSKSHIQQSPMPSDNRTASGKPKVIMLLIDSLRAASIDRLLKENKLPAIGFFVKNGVYKRDVVSSFPTMSVSIDSSMLTGTYPDEHNIPGLLWFHPSERRIVNYGDGQRAVWQQGPVNLLADTLMNLNQIHLSKRVLTIHEELHRAGFTSASINGLIYRGDVAHQLVFPNELLSLVMGGGSMTVMGPNLLGFGALSKVSSAPLPTGPAHAYGFHDEYTLQSLLQLIKEGTLPDVTFAYFPDLDGKLHKKGPDDVSGVLEVDERLKRLLDAFGDWERALDEHVFILLGDSGVTATVAEKNAAVIDLDKLIHARGYRNTPLGRTAVPDDDVAIAVNGRMCYVYSLSPRAPLSALVPLFASEPRIDLVAWKEQDWIHVRRGGKWLRYREGRAYLDEYGNAWDVEGDWSVLGLALQGKDRRIGSREYPDALSRLKGSLYSHHGEFLVATAVPGAEFYVNRSPNHPGGGNHGSLHREDSLVPMIVAGKGRIPSLPKRQVEIKSLVLSLVQRKWQ
ncbi:alkaline phosphatase family protein [Brevibacillus borstelensis]|uniref:alkaline phosphatase family protein n=1 Tax=Brevibacillus borstelensis TaxID=45462 RepID=UPI0030BE66CF